MLKLKWWRMPWDNLNGIFEGYITSMCTGHIQLSILRDNSYIFLACKQLRDGRAEDLVLARAFKRIKRKLFIYIHGILMYIYIYITLTPSIQESIPRSWWWVMIVIFCASLSKFWKRFYKVLSVFTLGPIHNQAYLYRYWSIQSQHLWYKSLD